MCSCPVFASMSMSMSSKMSTEIRLDRQSSITVNHLPTKEKELSFSISVCSVFRCGIPEAWRHGDLETWRHEGMEKKTCKQGGKDMETWKNMEKCRHGHKH